MAKRNKEPLSKEKEDAKRRYDAAIKEATALIITKSGVLEKDKATEIMDKVFEKHGFPELFREKVSSSTAESIIAMEKRRKNFSAKYQKRKQLHNGGEER